MQREVTYRGLAQHVDSCPKKVREWNGKTYANIIHDCAGCESFDYKNNKHVTIYYKDGTPSHDELTHIECKA